MPFALVLSFVYVLFVRERVADSGLRSHLDWQLTTFVVSGGLVVLAILLFLVGVSGIDENEPTAVVASYGLTGVLVLSPLWFLYRLVWGTIRYTKRLPMVYLFP